MVKKSIILSFIFYLNFIRGGLNEIIVKTSEYPPRFMINLEFESFGFCTAFSLLTSYNDLAGQILNLGDS